MFSDLSWFTFPSPVGEQDWGEEEDLPTLQNDSAKKRLTAAICVYLLGYRLILLSTDTAAFYTTLR